MTKAKTATAKDVELNRWCIEMAMKWPVTVTHYGHGGQLGGGGYGPNVSRADVDADVIGRAAKIMAWVKQQH